MTNTTEHITETRSDELTAYEGDQPYLFASYLHTDRPMVEAILGYLHRRGFRIWYDTEITPGVEWEKYIKKKVDGSSSFLCFLSSGAHTHPVVMEEISQAIQKKKAIQEEEKDDSYQIVFVFFDRIAPSDYRADIKWVIEKMQWVNFRKPGGITEERIGKLCSAEWPKEIIDNDYRKSRGLEKWETFVKKHRIDTLEDEVFWLGGTVGTRVERVLCNDYIPHGSASGEDAEAIPFYQISPSQVMHDTAYPIVMDNQWVPTELLDDDLFLKEGMLEETISAKINLRRKNEILKSLVHNWQIVVNRASMVNSEIFSEWYGPGSSDRDAFAKLLEDNAILLFLMGENGPADKPAFDHNKKWLKQWTLFCKDHPVPCLKFDWDNPEGNKYETSVGLGYAFQNFCLTLADDDYTLEYLEEVFDIPEDTGSDEGRNREAFASCWKQVQQDVIRYRQESKTKTYNRETFYKHFLVEGAEVSRCVLDLEHNEFAKEMKQIIDFQYALNLPKALGLRPVIPSDCKLDPDLIRSGSTMDYKEIAADELIFAVKEFRAGFLKAKRTMSLPDKLELSLAEVCELRYVEEWRRYINAVTDGRKRSHLDQVDFFEIQKVWGEYVSLLEHIRKYDKENGKGNGWEERPAALSILFKFDEMTLTAVYTAEGKCSFSGPPMEKVKSFLNRRSILRIDYMCCDVTSEGQDNIQDNILMTELRLFEGITAENGFEVYQKLWDAMEEQKK